MYEEILSGYQILHNRLREFVADIKYVRQLPTVPSDDLLMIYLFISMTAISSARKTFSGPILPETLYFLFSLIILTNEIVATCTKKRKQHDTHCKVGVYRHVQKHCGCFAGVFKKLLANI